MTCWRPYQIFHIIKLTKFLDRINFLWTAIHVTKKSNIRIYNKQPVSHLTQVCQEDSIRHRWVFVNANINPSQFIIVDFYAHRFDAVHVNFVLHETAMSYVRAHVYQKTSTGGGIILPVYTETIDIEFCVGKGRIQFGFTDYQEVNLTIA